jgi:hypothetical protein
MPKQPPPTEKKVKSTDERVRESIEILTKVRELGIPPTDPGYEKLSAKFNEWIRGGEAWSGYVDLVLWNRRAKLLLPTKPGTIARCDLLAYNF